MVKINALIPSAKVVPEELQNVGKLPAVIYPIGGNNVFDYLYNMYSRKCFFTVLCYESADRVHKKLNNYNNTSIVDVPELGDLAHTVYYGINSDCPLIINFGDTIVMDNILENPADSFYFVKDFVSQRWTYFDMTEGKLTRIDDKCFTALQKKEKLFVGVFYLSDSKCFKKCLEESFINRDESISAFYQALKAYSLVHPLNAIETSNWFDIGHADKYFNSKLEVQSREFNHIRIDKDRGILTKYSDNKDKFIGEIKWYLNLPSDVEYVRPRIFDYSLDYKNPYISMEYYAYHTIHELFLNSDLDVYKWEQVFDRIKFVCLDLKKYRISDENLIPSLEDVYLTKTIQRLDEMKKNEHFAYFFYNPIVVNGTVYKSLDSIADILKTLIPQMLYDVKEFNIIHGDLCFSNIMIDNNFSFVKLIDPRGQFGSYDIYGDSRYELAKLFHSVDGKYDYIIKDLFDLKYANGQINFTIRDKDRNFDLYSLFVDVFKEEIGLDLKKIELIEALLFLSMIPLHEENFNHQLVMLGTGMEILNRVVNIKESR